MIKILLKLLAFFPISLSISHSCAATNLYTVSYRANTSYAEYPHFAYLPSGVTIEGSFSYALSPAIQGSDSVGVFALVNNEVRINGVTTSPIVSSLAGTLQIGNNDSTTLGFFADSISSFAFPRGNNSMGSGTALLSVSIRFFDTSGNAISSIAPPTSAATVFRFPRMELLINYSNSIDGSGATFGNAIPLSSVSFTSDHTETLALLPTIPPVPEPETYVLVLSGIIAISILCGIRRKNSPEQRAT